MARTAEENRAYHKAYYEKHGARQRARQKERYQTDEEYRLKALNRSRIALYGITPERYAEMLHAQKGVCAVCDKPPRGDKSLAVDHCHTTGKVRGLLCIGCNVSLGHLGDDPDLIQALAEYVKRNA